MNDELNIFNRFKKELGYTNVSNQYIELAMRCYQKNHATDNLVQLANEVGLSISILPEDLEMRISRYYIVATHRCVEAFLLDYKSLAGSRTFNVEYNPKVDGSRMQWTIKHCFSNPSDQIKELQLVCEYYRCVRNHSVHTLGGDNELRQSYGSLRNINKMLLKSGITERLNAPNYITDINFDDQVLYSRAAQKLCKIIYCESIYNWDKILDKNHERIVAMTKAVSDSYEKKQRRIISFISKQYPVKDEENLCDAIKNMTM
jgi:hypothetical protein